MRTAQTERTLHSITKRGHNNPINLLLLMNVNSFLWMNPAGRYDNQRARADLGSDESLLQTLKPISAAHENWEEQLRPQWICWRRARTEFMFGDEVSCACLLAVGSSDCSWGGNVHVAAERKAGDQRWTEADRLPENLYWPRVGETGWHQTVTLGRFKISAC